jgi:hypothetical protein
MRFFSVREISPPLFVFTCSFILESDVRGGFERDGIPRKNRVSRKNFDSVIVEVNSVTVAIKAFLCILFELYF